MTKRQKNKIKIYKKVGYSFLAFYAMAAIALLTFCADLNMIPWLYMLVAGVVLTIFGVLFIIMQEKFALSILSDVLCTLLAVGCILGCYYINKTNTTIQDVATADTQRYVVSGYVMEDDPAQTIEDAADYRFGLSSTADVENTEKTVQELEKTLGKKLDTEEDKNLFSMVDKLQKGEIDAIILNNAYLGMIADVDKYEWVETGLRELTSVSHEVEAEAETAPDNVPESFVMYLSGIDTYGSVSTRSRSDVNILAVVNTKTKNILLLSTPRDYYVDYSVTGGARDKLTHAGIYGVDASIDALKRLYGIDIEYYLRINFTGFVDIIDALDGVEVYSDYDFTVENIRDYHQGYNQLTGIEALAFARERYSFQEGDYQRAKNQMEVIRAVVDKCTSSSMLANYSSVMDAIAGSFETNMPEDQIASLVKMQLTDMAKWNITSYTVSGTGMYAETYSMPGQELYVIEPDQATVAEAKTLIREVLGTDDKSSYSDESAQ